MSIATDLTRLQTAKADLKTAIEGKGVTVPSATKIDGYADLVDAIQTGGGGGGDLEAFMTRQISDYEDDYTIYIPARFIGGSFPNLKRIRLNNATDFDGSPYYQFQVIGRNDLVIVLPKCRSTVINCCNGSASFNVFDFLGSTASQIQQQSFYGCTNLATLIIRQSDGVMALQNINAFNNSPFASGKTGGTLYVPQSLISSYQSATNWSIILGYTNNSIAAIEGSQYENYYADGTSIPTT